jgi:hypothetical protein
VWQGLPHQRTATLRVSVGATAFVNGLSRHILASFAKLAAVFHAPMTTPYARWLLLILRYTQSFMVFLISADGALAGKKDRREPSVRSMPTLAAYERLSVSINSKQILECWLRVTSAIAEHHASVQILFHLIRSSLRRVSPPGSAFPICSFTA